MCAFVSGSALAVLPGVAWAQLPPAPAVEQEPSPEARKYFQIGVELLQDPDGARYEEAFKSFRHAYDLSPSWKMLGNLGLSALKLERDTEAIEAYERYLAAGGSQIDPAEKQQVQRDLDVMKGSTGSVTLRVKGGAAATIDDTRQRSVGGPVLNSYQLAPGGALTLRLVAGHHSIAATAGDQHASVELDVTSDTKLEQELELAAPAAAVPTPSPAPPAPIAPAPTPTKPSGSSVQTAGLIVGGVGVAALVGGAVTGIIGLGKKSSLNDKCPDHVCAYHSSAEQSSLQSDKDSLKTYGTATTALLLGGGVLAATGVTLFVVGSPKKEQVSFTSTFGPFGAAFGARGSF